MSGTACTELLRCAEQTTLALLPLLTGDGLWGSRDPARFDQVRFVAAGDGRVGAAVAAQVLRSLSVLPVEVACPSGRGTWGGPDVRPRADGQPRELTVAFAGTYRRELPGLPEDRAPVAAPLVRVPAADRLLIDAARGAAGLTADLVAQAVTGAAVGLALWQQSVDGGEVEQLASLLDAFLGIPGRLHGSLELARESLPQVAPRLRPAREVTVAGLGRAAPYAEVGAELLGTDGRRTTRALDEDAVRAAQHLESSRAQPLLCAAGDPACLADPAIAEVLATCTVVYTIHAGSALLPIETDPAAPWGPLEATVLFGALAQALAGTSTSGGRDLQLAAV